MILIKGEGKRFLKKGGGEMIFETGGAETIFDKGGNVYLIKQFYYKNKKIKINKP